MKIVKYPHPALRHKSQPLPMIDNKVRLWAGRMLDLMYEAHGLGLAANQPVRIDDGRPIATSFPDFVPLMARLGAPFSAPRQQ